MGEITRQQLCAELAISESTVRRLEDAGLPYTAIGKRMKRYNLEECKTWLRSRHQQDGRSNVPYNGIDLESMSRELAALARNVKLRVKPS